MTGPTPSVAIQMAIVGNNAGPSGVGVGTTPDWKREKGSDNPQQYLCDFLEEQHLPLRSNTDTRVEVELQERLFATACVYSHLPQRPTVITIPPTLGPCTLTLLTARRNDKRARGRKIGRAALALTILVRMAFSVAGLILEFVIASSTACQSDGGVSMAPPPPPPTLAAPPTSLFIPNPCREKLSRSSLWYLNVVGYLIILHSSLLWYITFFWEPTEVNPNAGPNHGTASLWGLRETPDLQDWDSAGHLQSAADQGYPVASTCCHSLVEEFEHRCPQRLQILRSVMQLLLSSDRTQPFPGAALPAVTLQGSEDEEAFQEFLTIMRGMLSIDDNETSLKARNTHLRLHLLSIEALLPIGDDGMDSLLVPSFELAYNSLVRMELTASKLGSIMDKLTAVGHVLRELITNFGSVGFFFGPIFMGPWWAGACFSAAFVIDGLVEWHIAVQDDGFHALLDQMWLLLKQTWAWWKQKIWALPQQTSVLLQKTWAMLTDKMSALLQRLWALLKRIRALLLGRCGGTAGS